LIGGRLLAARSTQRFVASSHAGIRPRRTSSSSFIGVPFLTLASILFASASWTSVETLSGSSLASGIDGTRSQTWRGHAVCTHREQGGRTSARAHAPVGEEWASEGGERKKEGSMGRQAGSKHEAGLVGWWVGRERGPPRAGGQTRRQVAAAGVQDALPASSEGARQAGKFAPIPGLACS
jgi:hypothetical protein